MKYHQIHPWSKFLRFVSNFHRSRDRSDLLESISIPFDRGRVRTRVEGGGGGRGKGGKGEREKIEKTHLSEGGSGGGRLLGLMRCRRYRREGCVRRVWCVRCVRCQRRVVLLTAVTTGAPHLEVRTCLVTVIPRFLLYHHSCAHRKKTSYPTLCVASFDLSSPR